MWFLSTILLAAALLIAAAATVPENLVFEVKSKFAGKREELGALKAHDVHRHSRLLSAIDLPLGLRGHRHESYWFESPYGANKSLYFTKIGLGTPSRDFHVQVDTGSDLVWVTCPKLKPSDAGASFTGKSVSCDDKFCSYFNQSECHSGSACQYVIKYEDGSSSNGHLVRDVVHLDLVTGNRQTGSTNGTIIFGCGSKRSGHHGKSEYEVDGILGFGPSNSSFISQLASQRKVKRSFAHCLDNNHGGGIFAIGEVVSPKVKTVPMLSKSAYYYSVNLNAIEVGNTVLDLSSDAFGSGDDKEVIIDSGTSLVSLPDAVYKPLMNAIMASHPQLFVDTVEVLGFACFRYYNVDGFPTVTFQFDKSVSLAVYPRQYLFQVRHNAWCFGWQNGGGGPLILGDMALSNKLVVYDIENQVIGWTNHNCSGGIQVKDEESGAIYTVGAHNLSWSSSLAITKLLTLVSLLIPFFCNIAL